MGTMQTWPESLRCHHLAGGVDWNLRNTIDSLLSLVTTLRVVWIEISIMSCDKIQGLSPPCGWCGLKYISSHLLSFTFPSPPCGWCGLKFTKVQLITMLLRHHLAGGVDWNIFPLITRGIPDLSPPCGWCGLKFKKIYPDGKMGLCHHLAGGVDWNRNPFGCCSNTGRHHLAGGVDWNIYSLSRWNYIYVTTLRVVWIEIYMEELATSNKSVTTLRVVWIEISGAWRCPQVSVSPPCGWCGLKL